MNWESPAFRRGSNQLPCLRPGDRPRYAAAVHLAAHLRLRVVDRAAFVAEVQAVAVRLVRQHQRFRHVRVWLRLVLAQVVASQQPHRVAVAAARAAVARHVVQGL